MWVLHAIGRALGRAGSMTKQITWSLILGFTSSAVVEAVIRRETIPQRLGDGPARHARQAREVRRRVVVVVVFLRHVVGFAVAVPGGVSFTAGTVCSKLRAPTW